MLLRYATSSVFDFDFSFSLSRNALKRTLAMLVSKASPMTSFG